MRINQERQIILHSDKAGIFNELWINPEIDKNVIERDLWISKGTEVGGFKGANEAIGTLVLRFDSTEELEEVMNNQNDFAQTSWGLTDNMRKWFKAKPYALTYGK